MWLKVWGKWIVRFGAAALTLLSSSLAFAQGCAMCYNNAAATKASGQQALRSGILILLLPPLLMLVGIFVIALQRRNTFFGDDARRHEPDEAPCDAAAETAIHAEGLTSVAPHWFRARMGSTGTAGEMPSEDAP